MCRNKTSRLTKILGVKAWPWKRIALGAWRILVPSIVAFPAVYFLRWVGLIKANEALYTAWVGTSISLSGWTNSYYREQKRFDDIDRHDRSFNAVDEVLKLLRTFQNEFKEQMADTVVGMRPMPTNPPSNSSPTPEEIQNNDTN